MSPLRGLRLAVELMRLMFVADRRRTLLSLTPIVAMATAASFLSARQLLIAAGEDDRGAMALSVLVFGAAFLASAWIGRVARTARLQVGEALTVAFQVRQAAAVTSPPRVEHFERSTYLDQLEVLRARSYEVNQAPRMFGWLVDSGGGLVVSVLLLLSVEPWLALVALGGIPATILNGREQMKLREARATEAERTRRAQYLYDLATHPDHADEVRTSGIGEEVAQRYRDDWRVSDSAQYRAELRAGLVNAVGWAAQAAVFALAVVGLVAGVRSGTVPPADLFLALGAMGLVVGQLGQAVGGVTSLGQILSLFEQLHAVEAESQAWADTSEGATQSAPEVLAKGIRLQNVSFRYPGAQTDALHDVTLDLPAGTVVALVGDNGAGKSTLMKILFGLYRPTGGDLFVDGVSLKQIAPAEWRERTAACFQDHLQLELLARENIGVGLLPKIEDEASVRAAADRATATIVLDRLPDGVETQLGQRFGGPSLSGGEWQRLSIARAMMRDDPLLLALDEPSAALDPLAESEIFQRYRQHAAALATSRGNVTVLISHRFSTVSLADIIVVLENARVAEVGAHDDLMARGGTYARMYELQAQHYR